MNIQAYKGTALATLKLHYALEHVATQMACLGFLFKFQEYWIERMVHEVKDDVHGNANVNPEVTAVKVLLCRVAANSCRCGCRKLRGIFMRCCTNRLMPIPFIYSWGPHTYRL